MAKVINADVTILEKYEDLQNMPADIEMMGRICYKSEPKGDPESFCKMLIKRGHESVLEHCKFTVQFICDRGVTHELVRHRIASFSQQSTRYCNYSKDQFNNEVTFININSGLAIENKVDDDDKLQVIHKEWVKSITQAEARYFEMLRLGATPQIARSVLPNSTASVIGVTANVREWREIFRQRTSKHAHPQMREIMVPLLLELQKIVPCLFEDIILDN